MGIFLFLITDLTIVHEWKGTRILKVKKKPSTMKVGF